MRRHAHLVIVLPLIAFAVGCPSTATTPPAIDQVTVDGDPRTEEFSLKISGRGFTTELNYDLSTRLGESAPALRVEVYNELMEKVAADRNSVELVSPQLITADIKSALAAGVWGVRIFDGREVLTETDNGFRVPGPDVELPDTGIVNEDPDGGVVINPDAEVIDPDGGVIINPDAEIIDGGAPDTGIRPDSGLGPFVGNYQFRQLISLTNPTAADAPANTTVVIPIAHGMLSAMSMSKADATDISIYLGNTQLQFQWDDHTKIGTNDLAMVAKLPSPILPGVHMGAPLVLYFGDPNASIGTTDTVYVFAERFANQLPNNWQVSEDWGRCPLDRPVEMNTIEGSYCATDNNDLPTRRTLASPRIGAIGVAGTAANQKYEVSLWLAGVMIDQADDMFYFAFGPDVTNFHNTTLIPAAQWIGFQPNVSGFTFTETTGNNRTAEGWRLNATPEWWKRAQARFVSPHNQTSLQFRFLSKDNVDNEATVVAVDDVTVRVALDPDFTVVPGPIEAR